MISYISHNNILTFLSLLLLLLISFVEVGIKSWPSLLLSSYETASDCKETKGCIKKINCVLAIFFARHVETP